MKFGIRWPDGRIEVVRITFALLIWSIAITPLHIAIAISSAYCESHAIPKRDNGNDSADGRDNNSLFQGFSLCYERYTNRPDSKGDEATDNAMKVAELFFVALTAGGTILTFFVYVSIHRTMKAVERAWVSLETLDILRPDPKGATFISAGFKNSGRAPARILRANITARGSEMVTTKHGTSWNSVGSLPPLGNDGKPIYDPGDFEPPVILVAGEFSRMIYEIPTNSGDEYYNVLTLRAGDEDKHVWIYGFVEYTDGISDAVRSYGWARRYDGARSKMDDPPTFRFAHVNTHGYNYAD